MSAPETRAVTALVLAGERPGRPDPVAQAAGVAHKALAEVGGAPMLARVAAALRGAGVGRIAVSTSHPRVAELARALGADVLPASPLGPSASVLQGARTLRAPLLVTTADHALLEPAWIERFLADAPAGADVCALLAPRTAVEAADPGAHRTWLTFADGVWSGCNLFLIRTAAGLQAVEFWRRVEAQRKRPWRMAALIGPGVLLRHALGRLTLGDAVERLGRAADVRASVVPCPYGLCAADVDSADDLRRVRARLGG